LAVTEPSLLDAEETIGNTGRIRRRYRLHEAADYGRFARMTKESMRPLAESIATTSSCSGDTATRQ
jgi:hypothetical protein